jgi:low temperature requirement protein LtrA
VSIANGHYRHGLGALRGRDATESGRSATPLELLYDVTFVAAFGVAAGELAHGIVTGHGGSAAIGFLIAMTTIVWAWTNFTWFASAFDNDDWLFRGLTMVQMAGVILLAVGLPALFASIQGGGVIDNGQMVAGYVVIRVAVALQWIRAARRNPQYRRLTATYAVVVGTALTGWILLAVLHVTAGPALATIAALFALEALGPVVAERVGRRSGGATPWHPHHLAERYALLAIIALGETVLGVLASATHISATRGLTPEAAVVIATGIAMSLALWWVYFLTPHGPALDARRNKVLPWAYGHILVFIAIAATGAGLHVVGYAFDLAHPVPVPTAALAAALPVLLFMVARHAMHAYLVSSAPRPLPVQLAALVLPLLAIVLGFAGWPLWACLLLTLASPVTVIVGYEAGGWRSLDAQLDRLLPRPTRLDGKA